MTSSGQPLTQGQGHLSFSMNGSLSQTDFTDQGSQSQSQNMGSQLISQGSRMNTQMESLLSQDNSYGGRWNSQT